MNNPFWLGSGGCPLVKVSADLTIYTCSLVGWSEFIQSTPPNYYRKHSISGGWTFTIIGGPPHTPPPDPNPPETDQGEGAGGGSGSSQLKWDPTSSTPPSITADNFDMTETVTNAGNTRHDPVSTNYMLVGPVGFPPTLILSFDPATPSGLGTDSIIDSGAGVNVTGSGYLMDVNPVSATVLELDMTEQHSPGFDDIPPADDSHGVSAGTLSITLSDPDDAASAVARAIVAGGADTPIAAIGPTAADMFTAGIYTVYESRLASALNLFGLQTADIQLVCAQLMPGVKYHPVVVVEQRDAVGDGTAAMDGSGNYSGYGPTWTTYGTLSIADFRPAGTTYTTVAIDLPAVAGKQIRIKSINLTPISG